MTRIGRRIPNYPAFCFNRATSALSAVPPTAAPRPPLYRSLSSRHVTVLKTPRRAYRIKNQDAFIRPYHCQLKQTGGTNPQFQQGTANLPILFHGETGPSHCREVLLSSRRNWPTSCPMFFEERNWFSVFHLCLCLLATNTGIGADQPHQPLVDSPLSGSPSIPGWTRPNASSRTIVNALRSATSAASDALERICPVIEIENPAQGLRSQFRPTGLTLTLRGIEPTTIDAPMHTVGWQLRSLGYGDAQHPVPGGSVQANGNQVNITRTSPAVVEWYHNEPAGLEHGFTLPVRPANNPHHEPLELRLAVSGSLVPHSDPAGQYLLLQDSSGRTVLSYAKLKVWDATGAECPATLSVNPEGGSVVLSVREDFARYPLTIDPIFSQKAFVKASATSVNDLFGQVIALSGNTLVVGVYNDDSDARGINGDANNDQRAESGAVYIYVNTGGRWIQQAYLKSHNSDSRDFFGFSVAIEGDTLVVGARGESSSGNGEDTDGTDNSLPLSGAAYVFQRSGTTWTQKAFLKSSAPHASDFFGHSVAISGDTLVVGGFDRFLNPGNDNTGAAHVFIRQGDTWTSQARLTVSNAGHRDNFGQKVGISGNTIVVGAPNDGSTATGINGVRSSFTATNSGAAYIFSRSGTTWSQNAFLKAGLVQANASFGLAAAVSGDTVVVGAQLDGGTASEPTLVFTGSAYVFVRDGSTWSQQARLKANEPGRGDIFGITADIAGSTIVVGAMSEDSRATGVNGNPADNSASGSGAAYVFVRQDSNWIQTAYLKASNTEAGDSFGSSVAISGTTIAVGARDEDSSGKPLPGSTIPDPADNSVSSAGAAYIFQIVNRMDVVQVLQEADGSVPLVRGKATFVRAFFRYPDDLVEGKPVEVQLRGQRRDPVDPGVVTDLAVLQAFQRQSLKNDSINPPESIGEIVSFELPLDWCSLDGLELTLEQISAPGVPIAQAKPVFQTVPDLQLRIYAAEWTHEKKTLVATPEVMIDTVDLVKSRMPVSNVTFEIRPLKLDPSEVRDLASVNERLIAMRALDGLPSGSGPIDYALIYKPDEIPNPAGDTAGLADGIPGDVASGFSSGDPFSPIIHELGHCLGRHHAVPAGPLGPCPSTSDFDRFLANLFSINADNKAGVCGECAGALAPDFPNFDTNFRNQLKFASIGPTNSDGLFLARGLSTFRAVRSDISYYEAAELMSYCRAPRGFNSSRFPSKFTYEGLIAGLRDRANAAHPLAQRRAYPSAGSPAAESWLVRGRFDGPENALRLLPVLTVPERPPMGVVPGGPLHLVVLGAGGQELARHSCTISFGLEPGVRPSFQVCIPKIAGAQEVRVVHQTTTLTHRSISLHAPTVKVLFPNGGELINQERTTLRWTASDEDNDTLTYTVQHSRDAGLTWETLDTDLSETTYEVARHFLKGGTQHLIRVIANDGMLTASDTSDAVFQVADSPPTAIIRSPTGGDSFQPTETIRFRGTGWDPEVGVIGADSQFRWESDRDGLLQSGRANFDRVASALSAGQHQLRLTVTDAAGATHTTQVTVQIGGAASPQLTLIGYDATEGVLQLQLTPSATRSASLQVSEDLIRWTTLIANIPSGQSRQLRLTNSPTVTFRGYRAVSP